ncbi:hypothetical protein AVEN_169813-2-1, partial [Araneus ventricosus]
LGNLKLNWMDQQIENVMEKCNSLDPATMEKSLIRPFLVLWNKNV